MKRAIGLIAIGSLFVIACAHVPTQPGARADLTREAEQTLQRMETTDPGLRPLLNNAVAYVVFPAVGSGGFLVGGGSGDGVLFEHGRPSGFVALTHLDVGALVGGQRYSQVAVINDHRALQNLKTGRLDFGAKATAVVLRTGAAANATFENGVAVFIEPVHGAMVNASLTGQRMRLVL